MYRGSKYGEAETDSGGGGVGRERESLRGYGGQAWREGRINGGKQKGIRVALER